jgi:hypothetical protein
MTKIKMQKCSVSSFVILTALILNLADGIANAESFEIKFLGNSSTTVNGSAGVVYVSGWTNIATATFTSGIIWSSDGSASATLTRSGPGKANLWHSGSAGDGGNGSLLDGYNDCSPNSSSTNVIGGLTGPSYTVYIYAAGDAAHPADNTQWLPNYTVNGTAYYTATVNGNGAFRGLVQGGITMVNNNTYPTSLAYGNYIEIDNVAPVAGKITISANSDNRTWRSPLNGIEIVASPKAPLIQVPPVAQRLYTNGVAQFSAVVQGVAPLFYNWCKNGVNLTNGGNISGAQTSILTVTNLALTDTGDYSVVVTNSFGSVTSLVAHLNVVVPTIADLQIDAFNNAFLLQTNGLTYYTVSLTNRNYDGTWTFDLDIQGAEDAYERTQSPQLRQLVNNLLTTWLIYTPPPWSWDGWNDDLGWFSLALIRGYQMTGNANFLAQAEYGFNYAFGRGWDTNYNNGGIWEEQPANDSGEPGKNPLACDSLLQTTCMIYQSTGDTNYLNRALQIYSWVRTNLFESGLICGSISTNGVVNTTPNLYNQGTFLDCANLMHNITGQQMYYTDALQTVEFTRNNVTANGVFNAGTNLATWAAEFSRAIGHFVKDNNLWSTYYPWMFANATAAWNSRRPDNNVSWNAWTQPTPTNIDILANWAVNAVAITQATPPSEPGLVNCTNQLHGTIIGTSGSWSGSGNTIAKVFDGNLNTYFDGPDNSGDWVGLDFGAGVSNVIGQINYWPRPGWPSRMLGGYFQGANNAQFLNAVTLFTIATAPPDGGIVTSQTITNTTAFRYVRYVGPANGSCNVAELQFFAPNPAFSPSTPRITGMVLNGARGLHISATNGTPGGVWILMQSTNVSLPMSQWQTNTLGNFDSSGNLSTNLANTATNLQEFYLLKVQ